MPVQNQVRNNECRLTQYMGNVEAQLLKGGIFNGYVVSRVVGTVGVSTASLLDAVGNATLFLAKGVYALSPIKPMGKVTLGDAFTHLGKAIAHIALAILNIVPAFVAPSRLQMPLLVAFGVHQTEAPKLTLRQKVCNKATDAKNAIQTAAKTAAKTAIPSKTTAIKLGAGAAVGCAAYGVAALAMGDVAGPVKAVKEGVQAAKEYINPTPAPVALPEWYEGYERELVGAAATLFTAAVGAGVYKGKIKPRQIARRIGGGVVTLSRGIATAATSAYRNCPEIKKPIVNLFKTIFRIK